MTTAAARSEAKQQFLSFSVGSTRFGIPILKVKEILQYVGATRVPGTPGSIRGVVNVRGAVVPIVDLGLRFGQSAVQDTKRTCVLVVETVQRAERLTLGVLADAVDEVVDLAAEEIEPPPTIASGERLEHVTGMGKVARGFLVLLDIDRVLAASEGALTSAVRDASEAATAAAA